MTILKTLTLAAAGTALLVAGLALATPQVAPPRDHAPSERCLERCAEAATAHRLRARNRAHRLAQAIGSDPAVAVVINLRAIERVYRADGRSKELPAFYREQLTRTQNPVVRNFVHYRLARLEMREEDAKGALEALQRNLEENLRRL